MEGCLKFIFSSCTVGKTLAEGQVIAWCVCMGWGVAKQLDLCPSSLTLALLCQALALFEPGQWSMAATGISSSNGDVEALGPGQSSCFCHICQARLGQCSVPQAGMGPEQKKGRQRLGEREGTGDLRPLGDRWGVLNSSKYSNCRLWL